MKTNNGLRCDLCGVVAERIDEKDFTPFQMPPNGRFPGISRANRPGEIATCHSCPACKPRLRMMMTFKNIDHLPDGPLKKALTMIRAEGRLFLPKVGRGFLQ